MNKQRCRENRQKENWKSVLNFIDKSSPCSLNEFLETVLEWLMSETAGMVETVLPPGKSIFTTFSVSKHNFPCEPTIS